MSPVAVPRARAGSDLEIPTFNPNGIGPNEITTRHMYSREDCGHNDPSMSPSSRSGRGAMALTPAPNGVKASMLPFYKLQSGIKHGALGACPLRSFARSTRHLG